MVELPSLPVLDWLGEAGTASVGDGRLTMSAGPITDWFNDPTSDARVANAPALVFPVDGDFQLAATVTVEFAAMFDAGVLFVHQGADDWAKFCFEFDPTGQPMVVSVVTRGVSDDSNEPAVNGTSVHLRVSRFGSAIAYHYATAGSITEANDERAWKLSRLFAPRDPSAALHAGFLAQSPTGDGCVAHFSNVTFTRTTLADARDGT